MNDQELDGINVPVSSLGLGTWVLGGEMWGGVDEREAEAVVRLALDQGITLFDTAPVYGWGRAESVLGRVLRGKRDQVIVATKCGLRPQGKKVVIDLSPSFVKEDCENSLRRLQTDVIDLYQIHWPDPHTDIGETVGALESLRKAGKIRAWGVCNFDVDRVEKAFCVAPGVSLQNELSLLKPCARATILPWCRRHQKGFLAYGVLGGGILSGKYAEPRQFPRGDARQMFYRFYQGEGWNQAQAILSFLKESGHPPAETALNWVRQQAGVTSVLVGCRTREQLKANLNALTWALTEDELDRLEDTIQPLFADGE